MAGQIGNNPLDRGVQPQSQPLDDVRGSDIKRVGSGFGALDSSSLNREGKLPAALQPQKPKLAGPATEVLGRLKAKAIEHQFASGKTTQFNSDIAFVFAAVSAAVTDDKPLKGQLQEMSLRVQSIDSGSPAILKSIAGTAAEIKSLANSGQLTEGKLQELMTELEAKLQDNSLKFNEQRIKSAQDTKHQNHEKMLEKYEKLTEKRSIFDLSHLSPGQKAGAILGLIFAPVAIILPVVAALSVAEAVKGPIGFSLADVSESSRLESLALKLHLKQSGSPGSKHERAARAYEGLETARTGLSHGQMLKLLAQQQGSEEQKEKLEKTMQALQAVQAGDIASASELLGEDLGSKTDSLSGDQLTPTQIAEGRSNVFDSHARVAGSVETAQADRVALERSTRRFG